MSVCPQCGAPTNPNDKFCNGCGFSLGAAPAFGGGASPFGGSQQAPPLAPQGFGAPPPPFQPGAQPPGGSPFGGPPPPASPYGPPPPPGGSPFGAPGGQMGSQPGGQRCQQGHDILPGQSYCAMGHPIALDQMFASDAYGAPAPSPFQPAPQPPQYGGPPMGPPPGGGGMPVQQANYAGGSSPAFPQAMPGQYPDGGYGQNQPPPNQGFGPPLPAFGSPPPPFAAPPPAGPPQGGQFSGGFPPMGAPPAGPPQQQQPPYGGFAAPPPQPGAAPPAIDMNPATRVLRGFLLSYQNNAQGDFWPLLGGRLTVGRANAGDGIEVQLADATISSRHAAFLVDNVGGSIHVEDTGSTNGTYVNEEHIGFNGRRELKDGDRIRFGGFTTIIKVIGRV